MAIANPVPAASPSYPAPILSTEQRTALRAQWKHMVADHTAECRKWDALKGRARLYVRKPEFPCYAHMLYAVLLGRDWRRGCSPITGSRKLSNGGIASWAYWRAAALLTNPLGGRTFAGGLDGFARVAPFILFAASVPLDVQYQALCRLPAIPTWNDVAWEDAPPKSGQRKRMVASPWPNASAIIDTQWPDAPYRD